MKISTSILLVATISLSANSLDSVGERGSKLPYKVLKTINGAQIRNGGFGSAMAKDPKDKNSFYALTDRGANAKYKGKEGKGKIFPTPNYTPRIGHFKILDDGKIVMLDEIILKNRSNKAISGLPNPKKLGGTNETPYGLDKKPLKYKNGKTMIDINGLDAEGLAVLDDGTFWVSDEYGPHIVHFDKKGREIGRINAFVNDKRVSIYLPKEFAKRRPNRGMEGLTITPNQETLVGIMQSSMYNPDKRVKNNNITRIVTINLKNGQIGQYLYKQNKNRLSNSEIVAINNNTFLVVERDGKSPLKEPNAQKHIYKFSLNSGTNIEKIALNSHMKQDKTLGLLVDNETLEQSVLNHGWENLAKNGIIPVKKELVVDLVKKIDYPHDKLEGLWVVDENTLGILNDDDFAITSKKGDIKQKFLNKKEIDAGTLYIIKDLNFKVN